jgi:DNA-binding GntR family transcriptional regulator
MRTASRSVATRGDTVLRAIKILRDEGLVFTVKRRGTYVTKR